MKPVAPGARYETIWNASRYLRLSGGGNTGSATIRAFAEAGVEVPTRILFTTLYSFPQGARVSRGRMACRWAHPSLEGYGGLHYRTRLEAHKRFMGVGTIALLRAAPARMTYLLGPSSDEEDKRTDDSTKGPDIGE